MADERDSQEVLRKLPEPLTLPTQTNVVALTRQQEAKNLPVPPSLQEISNRLREAQTSVAIATSLSNYKPIIPESAVQRRRGTNNAVEGGLTGENNQKSKAKSKVIAGATSINNQIADRAKELTQLGLQKTQLLSQTEKIENQISALSARITNLKNAGASIETIRQYEAQLETFMLLYDRTKATLERIKKLYDQKHKALEKLRETREKLQKTFWKNYDRVMGIIKKFREIPKRIKFPKLPKLPTLNLRKGNIKTKLLDAINKIKQASRDAAKLGITQSKKEAQEKIRDPKKGDTFQKAASKARDGLRAARDKLEAVEAKRQALIDATLGQVQNQVAQARAGIVNAQKQIESGIDIAAAKSSAALLKLQQAQQRAEQLRDSQLARLDNAAAQLAQQAAAGIKSAQDALNKDVVSTDLKASTNLSNASVDQLKKVDELKNSITNFLNQNGIKNFTTGVGIAANLRGARQQAMTLDQFKQKYSDAFEQGRYDSTSRIGNVGGVYIVVTAYYQKGNVAFTSMQQPTAVGGRTSQSRGTTNLPAGTMGSTVSATPTPNTPPATPPTNPGGLVGYYDEMQRKARENPPPPPPPVTPPAQQRYDSPACNELRTLLPRFRKLDSELYDFEIRYSDMVKANNGQQTPETLEMYREIRRQGAILKEMLDRVDYLQTECKDPTLQPNR